MINPLNGPPFPKPNERGEQIAKWLANYGPKSRYVVIDDMDLGITAAGHPFVQTDGRLGLSLSDARRAIELIEKQSCVTTEPTP